MQQPTPRQHTRPASSPAPKAKVDPRRVKAPPSDPKKSVPEGFVDPCAGIVFPQRSRRRR